MKPVVRKIVLGTVLASTGVFLVGCFPLLMGGAVTMTSLVAVDRRTSGAQLEDKGIELRARNRIDDNMGDRVHVNVNSYNRQVLLTGEVPSAQDKELVEKIVSSVDNVRNIVNDLEVMGNSTFTQRSSDSLVTGRVKAGLVDAKDVYAAAFKIVTERGTTYLMGRVTQREANRATEIARTTSGVQKVVRLMEYISEEELTRMLPAPAKESTNEPRNSP